MSSAYGHTGKGRYLDEYLGPKLVPAVMPVYYECIKRALPVYTIANVDDIYGRIVAYERLLLPFSTAGHVTHIIGSMKTISEDGGFEIRNLMRGNMSLPMPKFCALIDRDLFHRAPAAFSRRRDRIQLAMEFESANPSVVRSVKQRDLLTHAARARQGAYPAGHRALSA